MSRIVTAVLAGLLALSALAVDITLAAQPATASALGGEPLRSGLIVTAYLAGFAPGQLLWGLLADRIGRRAAVLGGLAGFLAATIACALARGFEFLLAARALQGLAGGAGPVLARTIVRDLTSGAAGARLFALLTTVLGMAPLVAPPLGAALLTLLDWRSVFWVTALYGALVLAVAARHLPETRPPGSTAPLSSLWPRTRRLAGEPEFVLGLALVALPFGGYHTILALYPGVAILEHGLSENAFAWLFAAAAVCYVLGAAISRRFVLRAGARRLMIAANLWCLAGTAAVTVAGTGGGLGWLAAGTSLYVLGVGQMLPIATAMALRPVGDAAGWAVALLGLVQIGGGALLSWAATAMGRPSIMLAVVLAGCSIATAGVLLCARGGAGQR